MLIENKIDVLSNISFENFDCKHKPHPVLNGLKMVCGCYQRHIETLYDEIVEELLIKSNNIDRKTIIILLNKKTGFYYEKYCKETRLVRGVLND